MELRVSWISTPDGRVIDTTTCDSGEAAGARVHAWSLLIGEDDILTVELVPLPVFAPSQPMPGTVYGIRPHRQVTEAEDAALRRAATLPDPLGGPLPGVSGSHLPEAGRLPAAMPGVVEHYADEAGKGEYSACMNCGQEIFLDGQDDEGADVWSHVATLDHFCEPVE